METVKFLTHGSPSVENLTPQEVRTANFPCNSVIVPLYNVPMVFADLTSRGLEIHSIDKGDFRVGVVGCGE
jgi:hypothetical protein